jgi:predicted permease
LLPIFGLILVFGMASGWVFVPVLGLREKSELSHQFVAYQPWIHNGRLSLLSFLGGVRGLGLAFIFLSYFMLYIFTVIFPYARMVSTSQRYSLSFIKDFLLNLQNMPLAAIIAGLMLQAVGLERPRIYFPIDIPIIISIAVFALGINFTTSDIVSSMRENIALCIIKFLMVPFFAFVILCAVSLDPHVEALILIQSFMSVAIYSVVASVLFGLDSRLASNLFVHNSIFFLVIILPLLFVFRGYIFGGIM